MSSPAVSQKMRAVACRHCSKPIRVPAMVAKREIEFQSAAGSGEMQFQLVSRVFNVRCRNCERESVYSINQIMDFAVSAAPYGSDSKVVSL